MATRGPFFDDSAEFKLCRKTITFTGAANLGAVGAVPIFTITGQVWIERLTGIGSVLPVSAGGGTLALGVTGSTSLFIGATTATGITAGKTWQTTTPNSTGLAVPAAAKDILIAADIIGTVATADVTAGAITFVVRYLPASADGALA
jgi:hypothetical protein